MPCAPKRVEVVEDGVPALGVDADGRFVEQQDIGVVQQPGGQIETPLHPAAERLDAVASAFGEADDVQGRPDGAFELLACQTIQGTEKSQVVERRQLVIEREILWNEANSALQRIRIARQPLPANAHISTIRRQQPGDDRHGGRLAGAIRAKKAEYSPWLEPERHVIDRHERPERLAEPLHFEHVYPSTGEAYEDEDTKARLSMLEYPTLLRLDFLAYKHVREASMRMLTRLFLSAAAVALLGGATLVAQTKATAENVPTIPHTSEANFFKLPPDLYFGEGIGIATNSKGHVFVYHRSGDTRLFEFDPKGNYVKEWGVGLYGIEFAHQVRVDRDDNVWVVDEGTNMVIKFNPAGTRGDGARPEARAGRGSDTDVERPEPLRARSKIRFRPADGRHVGCARQHFRLRWLREFASREVRQERPFHRSVRGRAAGLRAQSAQYAALDFVGRARQHLRRRSRQPPHRRSEQRPHAENGVYDNVGNPWAVCVSPGAHQYLFSSNSNPDSNPAASWAITGEIYKMELDGTIIGKFGKAGKGLGEFSTVHEIDCRNPDQLFVSEISAWRAQKILLSPQKMQPATSSSAGR